MLSFMYGVLLHVRSPAYGMLHAKPLETGIRDHAWHVLFKSYGYAVGVSRPKQMSPPCAMARRISHAHTICDAPTVLVECTFGYVVSDVLCRVIVRLSSALPNNSAECGVCVWALLFSKAGWTDAGCSTCCVRLSLGLCIIK